MPAIGTSIWASGNPVGWPCLAPPPPGREDCRRAPQRYRPAKSEAMIHHWAGSAPWPYGLPHSRAMFQRELAK